MGRPLCCGLPYLGVRLLSLSWGCLLPGWAAHVIVRCRRGVRLPPSSCAVEPRRWTAGVVVGSSSAAVASRRHAVSNLGAGLPVSLWAAFVRRPPPLVVVRCRTSALGCPRRYGQASCDGRLISSSCGVEPRRWAAYAVVGSPRAEFASPHGCVVSKVGIGQPTSV